MKWKARTATALSAIALTVGGVLATAAPQAEAVSGCNSGTLCIWDGTNFTGHEITSRSTQWCYDILNFPDFGSIKSYKSNLPVNALVWDYTYGSGWHVSRTLVAGGFSSNIGVPNLGVIGAVCTGGATPSFSR